MKEYSEEDSVKAHKRARHCKWAAVASVIGTAGVSAAYAVDELKNSDCMDTSGLRNEMFSDLYSKYGCSNEYEFDAFLNENSHIVEEVIEVNGKDMVFQQTEYTGLAQAASQEYWDVYDDYMAVYDEMASHAPDLNINLEPLLLLLTIPVFFIALYLYQRHKCKKIDRAIRRIEGM